MVRTSISLGQMPLVSAPLVIMARIISHENENNCHLTAIKNNNREESFDTPLVVRQSFTIEFQLRNICDIVLPLTIKFERSNVFVFSGLKEVFF